MFSLLKPTAATIQDQSRAARDLPFSYGVALNTEFGPEEVFVPKGFVLDETRGEIGHGIEAFHAAREAFRAWQHFDLGWVRVSNPDAEIARDAIVAVEAHTLGLWSLNLSRILYVIDEPNRFGYGYGTTALHVECGEERFLLEFYPQSGAVYYDLLAISRPAHWMARLAYPITRRSQRRFAHESQRRMRQAVASSV